MPNSNLTAIAVVLDRSGSMQGLQEATIAGLNQFLRGQRAAEGQSVFSAESRAYASDDSITYDAALDNLQSTDAEALKTVVSGTTPDPTSQT